MSDTVEQAMSDSPRKWVIPAVLAWLIQMILVVLIPVLLVIASSRLVMTTFFLQLEYTRSGFPEDSYGFSTADRLEYGTLGILYILNNEPINYLGDLKLEGALCYPPQDNDCSAFNQDELNHMQDVQRLARAVFSFGLFAGLAVIVIAFILWRYVSIQALRLAMMQGSLLTLGLVVTIISLAFTAWDTFFGGFHSLFFKEGTWQFFYSDTLIRLYPQQFWFDASLLIGGLTTLGAIIILLISLRLRFAK